MIKIGTKKLINICIIISIMLMSIGYSAINEELTISGEAIVRIEDDIRITNLDIFSMDNGAYETYNHKYSKNMTSMFVTLPNFNSSITYEIEITNKSEYTYYIKDIKCNNTNSGIAYEIINLEKNDLIKGNSKKVFNIKFNAISDNQNSNIVFEYEFEKFVQPNINSLTLKESYTSIVAEDNVTGSFDIATYYFSIDDGSTWITSTSNIYTFNNLNQNTEYTIKSYVVDINNNKSNTVSKKVKTKLKGPLYTIIKNGNKGKITDFSKNSKTSGTNGVYETNDTDTGKTVYYYRGKVNNNAIFANFCWKIIRTTESGGIKLIYNGVAKSGTCSNTSNDARIEVNTFNTIYTDSAYVGYMYGKTGANDYTSTHTNTNNSNAKTIIDNWYKNNMTKYTKYLEDAVYCNDRTLVGGGDNNNLPSLYGKLGYGTNPTGYGALARSTYHTLVPKPTLKCSQKNDKFTVSSENGNGKLTYPVGLITSDEVVYAGLNSYAGNQTDNKDTNFYLYIGKGFWTMSPAVLNTTEFAYVEIVSFDGQLIDSRAGNSEGFRPVISLNSSAMVDLSTQGTESNPYIIVY